MGRTVGALRPAPATVEAAAVGSAAVMSAAEEPTVVREGPAAGEGRPWRTCGLKE